MTWLRFVEIVFVYSNENIGVLHSYFMNYGRFRGRHRQRSAVADVKLHAVARASDYVITKPSFAQRAIVASANIIQAIELMCD